MLLKGKLKYLLFSFLGLLVMFFSFSILAVKVSAKTEEINPQQDINCSKYLNIMKNDYYMNSIVVSTLKINSVYNIGTKFANQYTDKTIVVPESMKKENIGFKCNGIFYSDYIELTESGTYNFTVYNYVVDNNIKKCSNSPLESITITINISDSVNINKKNFYYEHYADASYLVNDIIKSFNYKVSLMTYSESAIKSAFNYYLKIKNTNPNGDISSEVDSKNLQIEASFQGTTKNYLINLLSASNASLQAQFVGSVKDLTKNVPYIAFDTKANMNLIGQNPIDVLANQLDILEFLNYSEAQNIEASIIDNGIEIPLLTNEYRTLSITYKIKDYTLNK